jgi:hypothetical protein
MATHPNDPHAQTLYDHQDAPAPRAGQPDIIITGRVTPTSTPAPTTLYGGTVLQQHIDRLMADNLAHAPGVDTVAAQAREGQFWADIGQKTGFPDALLMQLAEASLRARRAAERVDDDPDAADAALERQIAAWNAEGAEQLQMTYGTRRGEELLHRTQRFIRQFPSLVERLEERGLGSRPDIVAAVAAHVHSTRWR